MTILVNHNGRLVTEHEQSAFFNGAFLYGDSLFETLKVHNGTVHFLQQHLDRLASGACLLGMPCPRQEIEAAIHETVAKFPEKACRLRLTLWRKTMQGLRITNGHDAEYTICCQPYNELTDAQRQAGAVCLTAPNQRVNPRSHLPQLKHGNYADCLYAWNFAQDSGGNEALFCTPDGYVLEGATSNLFLRQGQTLITPPTGSLVLAGIMRQQVLHAAKTLGFECDERPVTRRDLLQADEAFLSNSLIELWPIASWDTHNLKRGESWVEVLEQIRSFAAKNYQT